MRLACCDRQNVAYLHRAVGLSKAVITPGDQGVHDHRNGLNVDPEAIAGRKANVECSTVKRHTSDPSADWVDGEPGRKATRSKAGGIIQSRHLVVEISSKGSVDNSGVLYRRQRQVNVKGSRTFGPANNVSGPKHNLKSSRFGWRAADDPG